MKQRQTVVLAIDTRGVTLDRVSVLNFNLASAASAPINPAPLRPSLSTSAVATQNAAAPENANAKAPDGAKPPPPKSTPGIYYFTWPIQLTGDTIPTLTVNAVYVAPAPGDPRSPDTVYSAGSVVSDKGHFYTAINEGRSGAASTIQFSNVKPRTIADPPDPAEPGSPLAWKDLGTGLASGIPPASVQAWAPGKQFVQGSVIFNPINSHYYVASTGGFSGSVMPTFPVTTWDNVQESTTSLTWQFVGTTNPNGSGSGSTPAPLWTPNTIYQLGQVLNGNPGYYVAITAGQTGVMSPLPAKVPTNLGTTFSETSSTPAVTWTDLGNGVPPGVPPASILAWAPSKLFATGSVILFPANGHYYVATIGGLTGTTAPTFKTTMVMPVPDTASPGKITWEDAGSAPPAGAAATIAQWAPSSYYASGQLIADSKTGHYYIARGSGQSGVKRPDFPITEKDPNPQDENGAVVDGKVTWLDSGTVPPAAVANAGPTDTPVSLANVALPQVHSLYYFNIATGFAVSNVRNSTFTTAAQMNSAGTTTYSAQQARSSRNVEPILLFTAYLPGLALDAESPWKPRNLVPGLSFGFSMASPASSFYLGGSSEIWRNMQLAYGVNINTNINTLTPGQMFTAAAPGTTPRTTIKPFIGLTLNMDFIASFFNQKF